MSTSAEKVQAILDHVDRVGGPADALRDLGIELPTTIAAFLPMVFPMVRGEVEALAAMPAAELDQLIENVREFLQGFQSDE